MQFTTLDFGSTVVGWVSGLGVDDYKANRTAGYDSCWCREIIVVALCFLNKRVNVRRTAPQHHASERSARSLTSSAILEYAGHGCHNSSTPNCCDVLLAKPCFDKPTYYYYLYACAHDANCYQYEKTSVNHQHIVQGLSVSENQSVLALSIYRVAATAAILFILVRVLRLSKYYR